MDRAFRTGRVRQHGSASGYARKFSLASLQHERRPFSRAGGANLRGFCGSSTGDAGLADGLKRSKTLESIFISRIKRLSNKRFILPRQGGES
jgi:hypothetical protein